MGLDTLSTLCTLANYTGLFLKVILYHVLLRSLFPGRKHPVWIYLSVYSVFILLLMIPIPYSGTYFGLFILKHLPFLLFFPIIHWLYSPKMISALGAALLFSTLICWSEICMLSLYSSVVPSILKVTYESARLKLYRALLASTPPCFLLLFVLSFHVLCKRTSTLSFLSSRLLTIFFPIWLLSIPFAWTTGTQYVTTEKDPTLLYNRWTVYGTPLIDVSLLYPCLILLLLYITVILFYLLSRLYTQEQEAHEAAMLEQHYTLQKKYYEQFQQQQQETRALWHDMNKYLRAMQALTYQGASDEGREILSHVQTLAHALPDIVDVNNQTINVILNEYAQLAKQDQITLHMDVLVPPSLAVSASDLYILLGNTLDNALNACKDLPANQRHIYLTLRVRNEILYYEISNSFAPEYPNRTVSANHGYGLKNVRKCVNRYQGSLEILTENNCFYVIAHLNNKSIS